MLILSCLSSVASKLTYFGEGPFSFNTNLVALMRSVVGQYQAASQQSLVLAASEEALFAAYDAFWIEQVLHNLVGNALK